MKISRDQVNVIIKQGQTKGLSGQSVLDGLIKRGYEPEGIDVVAAKADIAKREPAPVTPEAPKDGVIKDTVKDFIGIGKDIAESSQKRADNIDAIRTAMNNGEQGKVRSILQTAGQLAGAGADAIGAVFTGAGKMLLSDEHEQAVKDVVGKFGAKVMADPDVQGVVNWYNQLDPAHKRDLDAVGGVVNLVSNFIGGEAVGTGSKVVKDVAVDGLTTAKNSIVDATKVAVDATKKAGTAVADSGIVQTGKELLGRIPRAAGRVADSVEEAGARAARIKTATPEVADAIKSNLDDRIINTVTQADKETLQSYKDVLKIAEESPTTIGVKEQPTIIGGKLAAEQFDLINKAKQSVGQKIGDAVKELSKTIQVDLKDGFARLDETLSQNGIKAVKGEKGIQLDFTGSHFTPAERTRIQELFNLATEGGDVISPEQIYNKNKLFGKLKREANMEGIGNIIVDTADGEKSSLFDVFRDTYSKALDDVSPTNIRDLNNQYRKLSNLTDDIEGSIFKTPNFQVVKSVDPAEFAKVNLRRIFGESQSSPVFEGVADAMDAASRGLGYKGASPKAVAEFAQEMRKLFPETIPKTGFTGGIKVGVGDVIEKISKAGAPTLKDQQVALRKLLDSLTK